MTRRETVVQIRPGTGGSGGRVPTPGIWLSLNRRSGSMNFSRDLCENCAWIESGQKVFIDWDGKKRELKIFPNDKGFTINARKSAKRVTGYGLNVKPLSKVEFPDEAFNVKGGTLGRFKVRILKSSIVASVVPTDPSELVAG